MKEPKGKQPSREVVAADAAQVPKSRSLEVRVQKGSTADRAMTDMMTAGLVVNAGLVVKFAEKEHGDLSLNDMVHSLSAAGNAINGGDLKAAEQMLTAQAVSLNAIYAELARRAAFNMGEYLNASERYMRLALKAQSQCRATLETLAVIKNPPVVFAKQANITNGGPQQVVNGVPSGFQPASHAHAPAHGESDFQQPRLLEGLSNGSTTLDAGAAGAAAQGHPEVETVGAIHRPAHKRGKG